jgi:hypothetical protein
MGLGFMRAAGLFSGIGGLERGLSEAGLRTILLCEKDHLCREVLKRSFPNVPIHEDIKTLQKLPAVELVAAGFPCQDLSQAGLTKGISGRNSRLFAEVLRLVRHLPRRPRWLLFENVPLPRIVLFDGRIGALGIEALVRKHPEFNPDELREALFSSDTPAASFAFLEREANEIRQLVGSVVMHANDFAGLQWLPGGEANRWLPVLLGGGGRAARFYPEMIMSTHEEFGQRSAGIPPYRLVDVPVPDDFDMGTVDQHQFHRFAIAYGLSVPFGERPELRLPSHV